MTKKVEATDRFKAETRLELDKIKMAKTGAALREMHLARPPSEAPLEWAALLKQLEL